MARFAVVILVVLMTIVGQADAFSDLTLPALPTHYGHITPQDFVDGSEIHVLTVQNSLWHVEWSHDYVWRHLKVWEEHPEAEGWNMYFLNEAENYQNGWNVTLNGLHTLYLGNNMFIASKDSELLDGVRFRWEDIWIGEEKHLGLGLPTYTPESIIPTPGTEPVPEPATIFMVASGLVGLAYLGRRRVG